MAHPATTTAGPGGPRGTAESGARGLSAGWLVLLFALLLVAIFSRRPQDLLHANFYAEDGKRWFAQAYNLHWLTSLRIPDASYLQVLPRLAAGVALWVPLSLAPLVMNVQGAAIQALPVIALLSRRCANWGPLPVRMVLSVVYIALPNAPEIHVNVTNAQWHFALLLVLLAFGEPPRGWVGRAVDVVAFLVGAFSGPFAIVLLPILLLFWLIRRERWSLVLAACLALGAGFQVHTILSGENFVAPYEAGMPTMPARIEAARIPLGATPARFVEIVGGDMFLNSMIGYSNVAKVPVPVSVAGLLLGGLVVGYGLWLGPLCLRLFALETLVLTAAALKSPVIVLGSADRWAALVIDGGMRYYFFPSLLFLWSAVYCVARSPMRAGRLLGAVVLAIALLGAVRKWEYPRFVDEHFDRSVARFYQAAPGERVTIPVTPEPWTMTLVKH